MDLHESVGSIHESMLASVVLENSVFAPTFRPLKHHEKPSLASDTPELHQINMQGFETARTDRCCSNDIFTTWNIQKCRKTFTTLLKFNKPFLFCKMETSSMVGFIWFFLQCFFWGSLSFDYNILPRIMVSFINRLLQKWREKSPEALRLHTTRHTTYRFFWKTRG